MRTRARNKKVNFVIAGLISLKSMPKDNPKR